MFPVSGRRARPARFPLSAPRAPGIRAAATPAPTDPLRRPVASRARKSSKRYPLDEVVTQAGGDVVGMGSIALDPFHQLAGTVAVYPGDQQTERALGDRGEGAHRRAARAAGRPQHLAFDLDRKPNILVVDGRDQ